MFGARAREDVALCARDDEETDLAGFSLSAEEDSFQGPLEQRDADRFQPSSADSSAAGPELVSRPSLLRILPASQQPDSEAADVAERAQFVSQYDPLLFRVYFVWSVITIVACSVAFGLTVASPNVMHSLKYWLGLYLFGDLLYFGAATYNYFNFAHRRRLSSVLTTLRCWFFFWWIVGQVYLFSTPPAQRDSILWVTCLALVCLDYAKLCCPVVALCFLCCFFPVFARMLDHSRVQAADEDQIKELPIVICDEPAEDKSCTICFESYMEGQELRKLPCEHTYHAPCVDKWLRINRTCPLCRKDITTGSGDCAPLV